MPSHDFETWTDGEVLTTANTASRPSPDTVQVFLATGGTVTASAAQAIRGSRAAICTGASGAVAAVGRDAAGTKMAVSARFKILSAFSVDQRLFQITNGGTSSPYLMYDTETASIQLQSAGHVKLGTNIPISPNTPYEGRLWAEKGTTTSNGKIKAVLLSDTGTVLGTWEFLATNAGTVDFASGRVGRTSAASHTGSVVVDNVNVVANAADLVPADVSNPPVVEYAVSERVVLVDFTGWVDPAQVTTGTPPIAFACTNAQGLTVREILEGVFVVQLDSAPHTLSFSATDSGGSVTVNLEVPAAGASASGAVSTLIDRVYTADGWRS